jgi:hypothetical protein
MIPRSYITVDPSKPCLGLVLFLAAAIGHLELELPAILQLLTLCFPQVTASPTAIFGFIMAPSAIDDDTLPVRSKSQHKEPLKLSGALETHESFDVTPIIGREFPKAKLVEWLDAENSDELLRDLAITSQPTCHVPSFCLGIGHND